MVRIPPPTPPKYDEDFYEALRLIEETGLPGRWFVVQVSAYSTQQIERWQGLCVPDRDW